MPYTLIVFILFSSFCTSLFANTFSTYFNFILPLTYTQLHLQFPGNRLSDISTLDISMIANHKSPTFWPQRIPFSAGLSDKRTNLFYYQFEALGYSKLINIPIIDPPIYDVAITKDGAVFSITSSNFYMHHYDFKSKTISNRSQLSIQSPIKCVSNHKSRVGILFSNAIDLYHYRHYKLTPLTAISNKINTILSRYSCLNMSINLKGYILVLTETDLLFFSPQGKLIESLANTNRYDVVDFMSYGDFLLGSTKHQTLSKYTADGVFLFQTSYINPKSPLSDLVIYQPYGNLCLISDSSGAYYSMNTSISIDYATYLITNHAVSIDTGFTLTFPSLISISIIDSDKNVIYLEKNKEFVSGKHTLSWDKLDSRLHQSSIHFNVKGLYSKANTIKIKTPLKQAL